MINLLTYVVIVIVLHMQITLTRRLNADPYRHGPPMSLVPFKAVLVVAYAVIVFSTWKQVHA